MDQQQLFSLSLVALGAITTIVGAYLTNRWNMQREKKLSVAKTKREQIEKAYRHIIELRKVVFVAHEFLQFTQFIHGDKLQERGVSNSIKKAIINIDDLEQKNNNVIINNAEYQHIIKLIRELETQIQQQDTSVKTNWRRINNKMELCDKVKLLHKTVHDELIKEYQLGSDIMLIGDLYAPELHSHFKVLLALYAGLYDAILTYSGHLLDYTGNDDAALKSDARRPVDEAIRKFVDHSLKTINAMSKSMK